MMGADDMPGPNRRRFLGTAAGAGAVVSAVGLTACGSAAPGRPAATGPGLADAVVDAFKTHRLVALGAADSLQNHYDVLGLLLTDPSLPGVVDDIIIEWGNALFQAETGEAAIWDRFGRQVVSVASAFMARNSSVEAGRGGNGTAISSRPGYRPARRPSSWAASARRARRAPRRPLRSGMPRGKHQLAPARYGQDCCQPRRSGQGSG